METIANYVLPFLYWIKGYVNVVFPDAYLRQLLLAAFTGAFIGACTAVYKEINYSLPTEIHLYSADEFERLGFKMVNFNGRGSLHNRYRRYKSYFGVTPDIAVILWRDLADSKWLRYGGAVAHPEHLLWALMFLRNYNKEEINASVAGCTEKTFRKWAWFYAEGIADLDSNYVSHE